MHPGLSAKQPGISATLPGIAQLFQTSGTYKRSTNRAIQSSTRFSRPRRNFLTNPRSTVDFPQPVPGVVVVTENTRFLSFSGGAGSTPDLDPVEAPSGRTRYRVLLPYQLLPYKTVFRDLDSKVGPHCVSLANLVGPRKLCGPTLRVRGPTLRVTRAHEKMEGGPTANEGGPTTLHRSHGLCAPATSQTTQRKSLALGVGPSSLAVGPALYFVMGPSHTQCGPAKGPSF